MKVYDCFMFFNELDLLEIRLNTLDPYVYKFVLVESTRTFSGKEKPLYYNEVKDEPRFANFKDKIEHIIYDSPLAGVWEISARRQRESNQRSALMFGLEDIGPEDIIIVSDADEIWNPEILSLNIDHPYRLKHKFFYYYFNCKVNELYASAFICTGKDIKEQEEADKTDGRVLPPQAINKQVLPPLPCEDTGWHFSWLKNAEGGIVTKIESFCHEEYDTNYYKDEGRIEDCIKNNRDLFDRDHMQYSIVPLDVPQYVLDNIDRFRKYIKDEESGTVVEQFIEKEKPRIFDCFMFFNELDLLEIRLRTLGHIVYKFVLVESTYTHSGKPKKLYFEEAKHQPRFSPFLHKIEHIIEDTLHREVVTKDDAWKTSEQYNYGAAAWINENAQRSAIIKGLSDIRPQDIVIISDADEITNPDIFPLDIDRPHKLKMRQFYYYFNLELLGEHAGSTAVVCLGKDVIEADSIHHIRAQEWPDRGIPVIENAGWHYSYLGSAEHVINKIGALAHVEFDTEENKDPDRIKKCLSEGKDIFNRDIEFKIVPVDGPWFLRYEMMRFGRYAKTTTLNRMSLRTLENKKDLIGAEIGVAYGANALNILRHLDIKKLYLIDPYSAYQDWLWTDEENEFREGEARKALAEYEDKIVWIKKPSEDAVAEIEDELDFVYIDGDHAYTAAKKDIQLYRPKVKVGGLLAGHDFGDDSVARAVKETLGKEIFSGPNLDGGATDWWVIKQAERIEGRISLFEQDTVMGVFTHRTTFLPDLLESVKNFLPNIQMVVKVADGMILENMERLRQEFLRTNKRFWVFLDDDIQFLDSEIIYKAATNLLANKYGAIGVYSTFDPNYILGSDTLTCQEVGWIPGYFIMVDSRKVGHVTPDMNLPHKNTAIDTTYSIGIRIAGYKLGISPSVVYHKYKAVPWHEVAAAMTDEYLLETYGRFYFDHMSRLPNIVGEIPNG